jgi:hypothetical protein
MGMVTSPQPQQNTAAASPLKRSRSVTSASRVQRGHVAFVIPSAPLQCTARTAAAMAVPLAETRRLSADHKGMA